MEKISITSLKNEYIQIARELNSLKGRKQSDKFLLEGKEIIGWALENNVKIDFVITSIEDISIMTILEEYKIPIFNTSDGLMKKITDTNYLVPIIGVGYSNQEKRKSDFLLVLDNVKDFGNIGTIIRTARAFGINEIMSTRQDFDLFQKKTIESSRGTVFKTQLKCFTNPEETLMYLRKHNFQIVTSSPYGSQLQSLVMLKKKPIALIVGNETDGASDVFMKNADITIQIPMQENVESLNVGVATGISIYELKLKQVITMIEQKIKSTLGRELNVTSMLIRETLDRALQKVSFVSSNQLVFLMVLKCDTVMQKIDIQKQFGILDSEYKAFMDPLLDKGLIHIENEEAITITEQGIETIGKLWPVIESSEKQILSHFSEDEVNTFITMINRIKENCLKI